MQRLMVYKLPCIDSYESLTWLAQNNLEVIMFSCIHFHFI